MTKKGLSRAEIEAMTIKAIASSRGSKKRKMLNLIISGCTSGALTELLKEWGGEEFMNRYRSDRTP